LCTLWNRSLLVFALLAAPSMALPATPLESGLQRGAFSEARSFHAMASAGAFLTVRRAAATHEPQGGPMLLASLGLLGLIVVRRLRALRAA
jgi:hypothetical protein